MKTFFGDRPRRVAKFFLAATVWIAFVAGIVAIVMLLWNWLMPELFVSARPIDYWQAAGLLLLCKILFSGGHGRWKHHRRWDHMSMEEREQLKQRFKGRWGDRWRGSCGATSNEANEA
ncbi:MAG: hypothetical protein ABW171_10760 [Steroidobacter sp.]